jgi:hypothetical protein
VRIWFARIHETPGPMATMNMPRSVPLPHARAHETLPGGVRLGLIVGTATWLWVAAMDTMVTGRPFHTFDALGGALVVTVVHYLLNVAYAVALLSVVRGAERMPSLIIGALFGILLFEVAFAMLTIILAEYALGSMAWLTIFGGSLVGTAVAVAFLARAHPLLAYLRRAEEET